MKKLEYNEFLKVFNEKFSNAEFEIISHLEKHYVLTKTKYGLCKSSIHHLLSGKCPTIRTALNKTEYFINFAKSIHNNKYDYSLTKFEISTKNIEYTCKKHGVISQAPGCHLQGRGCNKCKYETISSKNIKNNSGGYSLTNWKEKALNSRLFNSFKVYIIKMYNEDEEFYKIGRTFTTIEERFRKIPYKFKIVNVYEGIAEDMYYKEIELKKLNKTNNYTPKIKFAGMRECFTKINEINGVNI